MTVTIDRVAPVAHLPLVLGVLRFPVVMEKFWGLRIRQETHQGTNAS
jgi:hypothetical protein